MPRALKVATFSVRATERQSLDWKRAADQDGYASVGSWLAMAADCHLKARARAGRPLPLSWHRGAFSVDLEDGSTLRLPGFLSPPFGAFRGTAEGPGLRACHRYTLVHTPSRAIIATLTTLRQCKSLASELAPAWIRDQAGAAGVVERYRREDV